MSQTKPIEISKHEVVEAYKRIKANKGGAGIDHQSLQDFDADKEKMGVCGRARSIIPAGESLALAR